jgi:hypothetical protein
MDFPRHVHQAGAHRSVVDAEAYELALRDGWSPTPVAVTVTKGDETWVVYTADSLATAIADGWTVAGEPAAPVDAEPVADPLPTVAHAAEPVDVEAPARKRGKK